MFAGILDQELMQLALAADPLALQFAGTSGFLVQRLFTIKGRFTLSRFAERVSGFQVFRTGIWGPDLVKISSPGWFPVRRAFLKVGLFCARKHCYRVCAEPMTKSYQLFVFVISYAGGGAEKVAG